jgi:hypothetical protein
MKNNTTWKRVTAGLCSLALVAGTMPANVGGLLTESMSIVASAADYTSANGIVYLRSVNVGDTFTSGTKIRNNTGSTVYRKVTTGNDTQWSNSTSTSSTSNQGVFTVPNSNNKLVLSEIVEDGHIENYLVWTTSYDLYVFKYENAWTTEPSATALSYTGAAQYLVTAGTASHGTAKYKVGNEEEGTSVPQKKDIGRYTVSARIQGNDSYVDVAATNYEVEIVDTRQAIDLSALKDVDGEPCYAWADGTILEEKTVNGETYYSLIANTTDAEDDASVLYSNTKITSGQFGRVTVTEAQSDNAGYEYKYLLKVSPKNSEGDITANNTVATLAHGHDFEIYRPNEGEFSDKTKLYLECRGEYDAQGETVKLLAAELENGTYYSGDIPDKEDLHILGTLNNGVYEFNTATINPDDIAVTVKNAAGNEILASTVTVGNEYTVEYKIPIVVPDPENEGMTKTLNATIVTTFTYSKRPIYETKVVFADGTECVPYESEGGVQGYCVDAPAQEYTGTELSMPAFKIYNPSNNSGESGLFDEVDSYFYELVGGSVVKGTKVDTYVATYKAKNNSNSPLAPDTTLTVLWPIVKATTAEGAFTVTQTVDDVIVYDGEAVTPEDLTFGGTLWDQVKDDPDTEVTITYVDEDGNVDENEDGISAGEKKAVVTIKTACYKDVEIPVTITVTPATVTIAPDGNQFMTFGDAYLGQEFKTFVAPTYTVSEGAVASDLVDDQGEPITAEEFFGDILNVKIAEKDAGPDDVPATKGTALIADEQNPENPAEILQVAYLNRGMYGYEVDEIEADCFPNYTFVLEENYDQFEVKPKNINAADEDGNKYVKVGLEETQGTFSEPDLFRFTYTGEDDEDTKGVKVIAVTDTQLGVDLTRYNSQTGGDYIMRGRYEAINPDTYKIEFDATGHDGVIPNGNYTGTLVQEWGINKIANASALEVLAEGHSKVYDGATVIDEEAPMVTVNDVPKNGKVTWKFYNAKEDRNAAEGTGVVFRDTTYVADGEAFTEAPKNVGAYIVEAEVSAPNYTTVYYEDVVFVTAAPVTVTGTLDKTSYTFGEDLPTVASTSFEGLLEDEEEFFSAADVAWTLDGNKYTGALVEGNEYAGNYEFTFTPVNFDKNAKKINDESITFEYEQVALLDNGVAECPTITVTDTETGKVLVEGTDYKVYAESANIADKYQIEVVGMGNYKSNKILDWIVTTKQAQAEEAVAFTITAPRPKLDLSETPIVRRVQTYFDFTVDDAYTVVDYYTIYCNDGSVTDASQLTLANVDGVHIKKGEKVKRGNVKDNGFGILDVGCVRVKDAEGTIFEVYTEGMGGSYAEVNQAVIDQMSFAAVDPYALPTDDPTDVDDNGQLKERVKVKFEFDDQKEGITLVDYGIYYHNDGIYATADELFNNTDDPTVKFAKGVKNGNIWDKGDGVVAAAFVTFVDSNGTTFTLVTDDLGGHYDNLPREDQRV